MRQQWAFCCWCLAEGLGCTGRELKIGVGDIRMGGWCPGAGCQPGWHIEPRKQWAEKHEESTSCQEASKDRAGLGQNLDAGLGQQDAHLQAGGRGGQVRSCSGLALNLSLLRPADNRAEPGGMVRLTRRLPALRGGEQWAHAEPPLPYCLATSAPTSPAKPRRGSAAALLTQKRVACSC